MDLPNFSSICSNQQPDRGWGRCEWGRSSRQHPPAQCCLWGLVGGCRIAPRAWCKGVAILQHWAQSDWQLSIIAAAGSLQVFNNLEQRICQSQLLGSPAELMMRLYFRNDDVAEGVDQMDSSLSWSLSNSHGNKQPRYVFKRLQALIESLAGKCQQQCGWQAISLGWEHGPPARHGCLG